MTVVSLLVTGPTPALLDSSPSTTSVAKAGNLTSATNVDALVQKEAVHRPFNAPVSREASVQ